MHFEGSSAPFTSPDILSKRNQKQSTAEAVTAVPEKQVKQVSQSSESTSLSRSSIGDKQKGSVHMEELPLHGRDLLASNGDSDNLLAMKDDRCVENARVHLDMSSCSVRPEDKVKKKTFVVFKVYFLKKVWCRVHREVKLAQNVGFVMFLR